MCCVMCSDNRFELIKRAKNELFEATNINDSPDEIAVLDSLLFRCWQMGWLDKAFETRTCHDVSEPPKDATFWPAPHFKCSECGATHVSMEYVYYCPSCGRRVVK